ncbi:cache domain-containing protein [Azospirillum agricola]|uniref:cache domain-containing protein n=1 Tax=Azospirillum agricola TaxID=1720247 RepID=UPI001CC03679|nr:hypothetical protein [Azospirillum agricola]
MRNPVPFRLGVPLAAAIALAVVWVGYFQMADALFESQKRDAIAGAETTARAYESSTGRTLHEIDITLKNFVAKYAEGGLAQARRIVDEGLYDLNLIHHFSVFDRTGAMVFRSAGHGRGEVLDDEAILPFHQGVGRSLMRVGLPYAGSETGRPLLRFTRRIDDADGRFAGVVSANVDPDYLSDFYRQADIGPQGVVSLVGLDHVIRARGVKQGGTTESACPSAGRECGRR